MIRETIPFGKEVIGRVDEVWNTRRGKVTIFISNSMQGYVIAGVDHDVPVGPAMIRFTEGGPLGGYWQPLPLTIGKG